jgi:hypothetical protein
MADLHQTREIKQAASLIAQMNRLPNSLVGSRLEQRR